MNLYGNIINTSNTRFQFDKIYSSRYDMDRAAANGNDTTFVGRFVLVQYDPQGKFFEGNIVSGYKSGNIFYADISLNEPFIFTTFSQVNNPSSNNWNRYYEKSGQNYFRLPSSENFSNEETYYQATATGNNLVYQNQLIRLRDADGVVTNTYYKCIGTTVGQNAEFEEVVLEDISSNYLINYNKDKVAYGNNFDPRGYDATVWQKIYNAGKGSFILISYLNCLTPGLELVADPPSFLPSQPYIDGLSGGGIYQVHVPSHWGFQIKEAEGEFDSATSEIIYPYSDQMITRDDASIHGDIYLNLGGSSSAAQQVYHKNNSHKDLTNNKIELTATGESGAVYHDAQGNEVRKDMLELSIHLPAIGNMIDDGYDLIYGKNNNNSRPQDINWYSGDETESLKQNGNSLLGGKTYDLTTLAGNINTMHNILGQIIIDLPSFPTPNQIASLSSDYIYRYNSIYYRKGITYNPTVISNSDYVYQSQPQVSANDFKRNKYYIQQGSNFIEATSYNSTLGQNGGYFLKDIGGVRYKPINLLLQFHAGQYYYKDGVNYYCDNSNNPEVPLFPDRTYYTNIRTDSGHTFQAQYEPDGSYYTLNNGNYTPSYAFSSNPNTIYYSVSNNAKNNGNPLRYYAPNCYYYQSSTDAINGVWHFADDNHVFNPSTYTYFVFVFDSTPQYGLDSQGNVIQYYSVIERQEVTVYAKPNEDLYILLNDGTYMSYDNIMDLGIIDGKNPYVISRIYYTLNVNSYSQNSLYIRGVYYRINANHDYIIDNDSLVRGATYYLITGVDEVTTPFYLPDTYWYQVGTNEYTKDPNIIMSASPNAYYTKDVLYVYSDTSNQCPYGYEWNDNALYIPPSISLCTMEKTQSLIPLSELNQNSDTLYGLVLALNTLYAKGDDGNRDTNTIRGIYNTLKDILYSIQTLKPGYVLMVNDFGQIESSNIKISDITTNA